MTATSASPLDLVLAKLPHARRYEQGGETLWRNRCFCQDPNDRDGRTLLDVRESPKTPGKVLLTCYGAGCHPKDIAAALGLDWAELQGEQPKTETRPSTATSPNLRIALEWAALGAQVLPVCGPNEDHECGCPESHYREKHLDKDIGKAPRTDHGVYSASSDLDQIRKWWTAYPNANVAVRVDTMHAFVVDCDSAAAEAEAVARGLPRGPRRVSGHGNAYFFRRPEGCPIYRPTHKGESKSIDLLTGGYVIVYGTHKSGADIYCEPVELPTEKAPDWAVELLKAAADKSSAELEIDDDEPPVPLFGNALQRWKGELFQPKKDGSVDRSESLFFIGMVLAEAGMTANGILQAVAERDRTLGWKKYSSRAKGGQADYADIARKTFEWAKDKANEPRLVLDDPPPASEDDADPELVTALRGVIEKLRQQNRQLRGELQEHHEIHRLTLAALRNGNLQPNERMTLVMTIYRDMEVRSHGEDPGEFIKASSASLGESIGLSRQRTSALLDRCQDWGFLEKRVTRVVGDVDPDTGRPQWKSETKIKLAASPRELLAKVATFVPERETTWGGKPDRNQSEIQPCDEHPDAPATKHWTITCDGDGCGCGAILGRGSSPYRGLKVQDEHSENRVDPEDLADTTVERVFTSHLETSDSPEPEPAPVGGNYSAHGPLDGGF